MATAEQVVRSALQEILVQAADSPIEADEGRDAIFAMNNYMFALDAKGVSLGYTEVSTLGQDITIPPGAIEGLVFNLAIRLAKQFNKPVTADLAIKAADGLKAMRILGQRMGRMSYGSTLPVGSGNYEYANRGDHFYPSEQQDILAETTGAIGLETGTEDELDAT